MEKYDKNFMKYLMIGLSIIISIGMFGYFSILTYFANL